MSARDNMCFSKTRYFSKIGALIVAHKRAARGAGELRAYPCPNCKGWHLTKQPLRTEAHA